MKKINILALILLGTLVQTQNNNHILYFDNGNIKLSSKELITLQNESNLYLSNDSHYEIIDIDNVYFYDNNGYYITLKNNDNYIKNLLIKDNFTNYEVIAVYENNFVEDIDETPYYISAIEFSSYPTEDFYNSKTTNKILKTSQNDTYSFFEIENYTNNLYIYGASFMSEVYIKDVPNYMNTMYNHYGCVPTTCAMLFAYLEDNGYSDITGYRNLPVNHTDNITLVNNYIKYLGDTYFETTNSGTLIIKIPTYYNLALDGVGYGEYYCKVTNNFAEYANAIYYYANPVPLLIYGGAHSVLGIGYTSITNSPNKNENFVKVNFVADDEMAVATINAREIYQYEMIVK